MTVSQHSTYFCRHPIDTCESVDTANYCLTVNQVPIEMLIDCQSFVNWVSVEMTIKCWLSVNLGSIKDIDQHLTGDAFGSHYVAGLVRCHLNALIPFEKTITAANKNIILHLWELLHLCLKMTYGRLDFCCPLVSGLPFRRRTAAHVSGKPCLWCNFIIKFMWCSWLPEMWFDYNLRL